MQLSEYLSIPEVMVEMLKEYFHFHHSVILGKTYLTRVLPSYFQRNVVKLNSYIEGSRIGMHNK